MPINAEDDNAHLRPDGRVLTEVQSRDPEALRTHYRYDTLGRLVETTYPDSSYEQTTYNAEGNEIAKRDRLGRVTKMVHDAANRLVETIHPDSTPGTDADNPRTRQDVAAR